MPVDREEDWSITQNAEIERIMGVLPDVLAAEHRPLSKGLLQAGMEFVAVTRRQRARYTWSAGEKRRQNVIQTSLAREHEVLIERRLQRSRVGDSQDGARGLYVVRNSDAGLNLASYR